MPAWTSSPPATTSGNTGRSIPILESESPILRPLNYPPGVPGRGLLMLQRRGRHQPPGPHLHGRRLRLPLPRRRRGPGAPARTSTVIIVDMHAEATSEKAAMGWYLDGRVSAVIGTHTHVATADARILPKGTAFVTDVGMVGPRDSIIGMEVEPIVERFLTQLPTRFSPVETGPAIFNSVLLDIDEASGRALQHRAHRSRDDQAWPVGPTSTATAPSPTARLTPTSLSTGPSSGAWRSSPSPTTTAPTASPRRWRRPPAIPASSSSPASS